MTRILKHSSSEDKFPLTGLSVKLWPIGRNSAHVHRAEVSGKLYPRLHWNRYTYANNAKEDEMIRSGPNFNSLVRESATAGETKHW